MHDMEFAVIIHALKIWKRYLVGKEFLLLTQNVGLKYCFDQNTIKSRQGKWISFQIEYDFEIKNIKGKENIVANSLSQQQHELHIVLVSGYESKFKKLLK